MSNFQELQGNKLAWKLSHDQQLFEKINYLQDNVVASSHLVHNSIDELNRAISAADTTLNNAINAFGQLNYTKFLENVVEDVSDAEKQAILERKVRAEEILEQTQHEIDLNGEKEKIQFALELAIHEVTKGQRQGGEEEQDLNETKNTVKIPRQKGHLGTNLLIKLPYVIGTPEYQKHPFAGVVFANTGDEQEEHFKEERAAVEEDRAKERLELEKAQQAVRDADAVLQYENQKNVANIPAPPPGDLGDIPPPRGFGAAYVPALVAGGIMSKPEVAPEPEPFVTDQDDDVPDWKKRAQGLRSGTGTMYQQQFRAPTEPGNYAAAPAGERKDVDLVAMMNAASSGGGLFGGDALTGNAESKQLTKAEGALFDDDEEVVPTYQAAPQAAPPRQTKPKKQKGMFDDSEDDSDSDADYAAATKKKPAQAKGPAKPTLLDDSDDDDDTFVPKQKQAPPAAKKQPLKAMISSGESSDGDLKIVKKPAAPAKKQALMESSDDSDFGAKPAPAKAAPAKAAPAKAAPAKKGGMFDDSDDDSEELPVKKAPAKPAPVAAAKKASKLMDSDDDDDDDLFAPVKKPLAKKPTIVAAKTVAQKKTALFANDDDDDDDDDMFTTKKSEVAKPAPAKPAPAKAAPAKKAKLIMSDDDDDDDLPPPPKKQAQPAQQPPKEPEPAKVAPPASKPPAQPPKAAEKEKAQRDDSGSPSRMSMAELAAKINMAAVGGGNPMNNPKNPLAHKKTVEEPPTIIASTIKSDGTFNHTNFARPKMAIKKQATIKKKPAAMFDSDDEDFGGVPSAFKAVPQQPAYQEPAYQQPAYQEPVQQPQAQQPQQTSAPYDDYDYSQPVEPVYRSTRAKKALAETQQQEVQEEPQRQTVAKKEERQTVSKKKVIESDDDEDFSYKAPATQPKAVPAKAAKKPMTFDDSDDNEMEQSYRPPPKPAAPAKAAPAKKDTAALFDGDSDDEDDFKPPPPKPAAVKKVAAAKKKLDSDDDDSDDFTFSRMPPPKKAPVAQKKAPAAKGNLFDDSDDDE